MGAEEVVIDDELDDAEIVHWYASRPMTVSTTVAAGSIVAAFALGVAAAVGALALMGHLDD